MQIKSKLYAIYNSTDLYIIIIAKFAVETQTRTKFTIIINFP